MRILHYVFCSKETGYGHWFRSMALAEATLDRGHIVYVLSDRRPDNRGIWIHGEYNNRLALAYALSIVKPDWLVVDLPDTLPSWVEDMATCNICVLNGIGYDQANNVALRVIQGVADLELPKEMNRANTVIGTDYVIIRPEIKRYRNRAKNADFFVWGGGNDHLGLIDRFGSVGRDWSALIAQSPMIKEPEQVNGNHQIVQSESPLDMFGWMARSKRACVAMGVVAWELAYLHVPTFVFSYTDLHLTFAQGMARHELIQAWHKTGLPENDQDFYHFLTYPFEITGRPPDGQGAMRIVKLMEQG